MYAAIVRLLGLGSIVACTIVIVAFALFAINQTSTASTKQAQSLASGTALATPVQPANAGSPDKSPVRNAIEEASEWLTSPFAGVTSGHSEWAIHAVNLLLALLVYGFCVGFLARSLRVRM